MSRIPLLASLVLALGIVPFSRADDLTIETAPPVVVRTEPAAGSIDVDAGKVKQIRVTFSKDMLDGNWSWVQLSKESFPTVAGKISYDKDGRTCLLPVKLEPGKTYSLWINTEKFANFKDAGGQPAVPYLLVFRTKS